MVKEIKEFISGMSIVGLIMGALLIGGYIDTHYTREATVVDVVSDEIVVIDEFGDEWSFIGNGYKVNDNVTLVIHNNTTMNTIADDKIIDIK